MVEMRWLELRETDTSRVLVGNGPFPRKRVLQYREGEWDYDQWVRRVWIGTDWRDVPTETE